MQDKKKKQYGLKSNVVFYDEFVTPELMNKVNPSTENSLEKLIHMIEGKISSFKKPKDASPDEIAWSCSNFYMTSAEGEMHIRQYNHSRTTPSVRKDILQIYNKYIISAENLIKEVNNVSENTHLEEFDRFTVDVKCADHLTKIALALDTYIINHGINKWRMLEEVRINYNKILDVLEPYLNTKTHPEYQTSERLSYK